MGTLPMAARPMTRKSRRASPAHLKSKTSVRIGTHGTNGYHLEHPVPDAMPSEPLPRQALPATSRPDTSALSPETTIELLSRARAGDEAAKERLLARCLPALRRWAHGRLPLGARDMHDTVDLVQDTVISALRHLDRFEPRHEGALQAYLRQALSNRIKDLLRQKQRRPIRTEMADDPVDVAISPLERILGQERMDLYEAALEKLRPSDREAIIARVELQYDYEQLAVAIGKPSANAARVAVTRAIHRLVQEMRRVL